MKAWQVLPHAMPTVSPLFASSSKTSAAREAVRSMRVSVSRIEVGTTMQRARPNRPQSSRDSSALSSSGLRMVISTIPLRRASARIREIDARDTFTRLAISSCFRPCW